MLMNKSFYISDTHFGHKNIIRYDNRPFFSADEMDKVLIDSWNKVVSKDDTVYILGDISWHGEEKTIEIMKSLNGKKVLIRGNHDRVSIKLSRCFMRVADYAEIIDGTTKVIMSHYPMPFWNGQFRDSVHLYGHIHNSHQWNIMENWMEETRRLQDIPMRAYNVGCMMPYMNYTPRTLNEILEGYKQTK